MSPGKTVSHFICCSIRPGKSPERSHISSEPYEPISPPQVPVVHEKQDSVLLLAQRGAEPAEQRYAGAGPRGRACTRACSHLVPAVFLKSVQFFLFGSRVRRITLSVFLVIKC